MNNSLDTIKLRIFKTFRLSVIILFIFIAIYAPVTVFINPGEHVISTEIYIISIFSVIVTTVAYYMAKIKISSENKTTALAFTYLFGVLLVFVSSYI